MASSAWYYTDDAGRQCGPVSQADLRRLLSSSAALARDAHVWEASMADWQPASAIPGLVPAPPPPATVQVGTNIQGSRRAAVKVRTGIRGGTGTGRSKRALVEGGTTNQTGCIGADSGRSALENPTQDVAALLKKSSSTAKKVATSAPVQQMPAPSSPGWVERRTVDGAVYFLNEATGQTTWDPPPGFSSSASSSSSFALVDGETYWWVPDDVEAFAPGRLVRTAYNGSRDFELPNGRTVTVGKGVDLHPVNTNAFSQNYDDLVMLQEANEPMIVHCLGKRFRDDQIYTNVGTILIAVNPYRDLGLYSPMKIEQYKNRGRQELPPHVFVVADQAYRGLLESGRDQSVIISGESGAGKTEATKQCLQYLAECAGSNNDVEQRILLANPILEAFGNAKTVRNSNSSRFGKYIEVFFGTSSRIVGSSNTNYLLEKSRVVSQSAGERNYHVFFQLCRGASPAQADLFGLRDPSTFAYLNQVQDTYVDKIDDAADFAAVEGAMQLLGFTDEEATSVFGVVAAVLHLGDLQFESVGERQSALGPEAGAVRHAARLLQVPTETLVAAFTTRLMRIRGQDTTTVTLSRDQAGNMRHAAAKFLYARLFDWLVARINRSVAPADRAAVRSSIGVLDIFGFEVFATNSFEQLCINYTNEKLQQHFNRHTFRLEEALYESEGIAFQHVAYIDNQPVLDLIDGRPTGLLPALDEELRLPRTTDATYVAKLHALHGGGRHPSYGSVVRHPARFVVRHYAGPVEYASDGFLDKNNDTMSDDLVGLFAASHSPFLKSLFPSRDEMARTRKVTLGGQFQAQLADLMVSLERTHPHYIRCVKPNADKRAGAYTAPMVHEQLRYSGVYEAVAIRKRGYPFRYEHGAFAQRYLCSVPGARLAALRRASPVDQCRAIIGAVQLDDDLREHIQVGRTRILYRSPVHRRLELERTVAVERLLVRLQAHVRRWQAQGAVRRWRVVLRDPIRAAVRARDLPALTAALEPATALAQRFPFRELIEARAARARLVDLADLHRELERVRALDPERHYDAYLAACEWADRLGERSAPCDAVRQRLEQVQRRRDCMAQLEAGMTAHDMALLDEALSRARDLNDDGCACVPGDLVRRAQAARDRLRLENAACDAIRAAMGAGGWLRPGDLPDIDGIASAVDGAGRLGLHVAGGADLIAQGGTLRDLRAAMARADGSKDAAVWAPVEAIVKSAAGALADHDEVRAARAQVVQFARTGRVERDLIGAVAARDLAAIEHGLDQAAGLHMSDDKYPILADARWYREAIRDAERAMAEAVRVVSRDLLEDAGARAAAIQYEDVTDDMRAGMALLNKVRRLADDAASLVVTLLPDAMRACVADADAIRYAENDDIGRLRALLFDTSPERFLQLQLKAAVALKDAGRARDVTIALKDAFFARSAAMFAFRHYPGLCAPAEWASRRLFGMAVNKAALAASFYAHTSAPIHAALTRDLDPALEKLARTVFRTLLCFMGDRQNSTMPAVLVQEVVALGAQHAGLRAEILAQVVKQLTGNPSRDSSERGWQALALCIRSWPVPADIENYLECWIRTSSSQAPTTSDGGLSPRALRFVTLLHESVFAGECRRPVSPVDVDQVLRGNVDCLLERAVGAPAPAPAPAGPRQARFRVSRYDAAPPSRPPPTAPMRAAAPLGANDVPPPPAKAPPAPPVVVVGATPRALPPAPGPVPSAAACPFPSAPGRLLPPPILSPPPLPPAERRLSSSSSAAGGGGAAVAVPVPAWAARTVMPSPRKSMTLQDARQLVRPDVVHQASAALQAMQAKSQAAMAENRAALDRKQHELSAALERQRRGLNAAAAAARHPEPGRTSLPKKEAAAAAWTAHVDPSTQATYYYNASTGVTQWDRPGDPVSP
ncbi:Myosin head (motor domain) [Plasmodiophora brassicae]